MLTKSEQLFLLELLLHKKIQRHEQKIFKSSKFYQKITKLKRYGLVESKKINKTTSKKHYFLTYKGFLRANFIGYDPDTPEKYNKVIQELTVIP